MTEVITVAILGNAEHAFDSGAFTQGPHGYPREFDLPYEDLPKITLNVDDDEALGSILGRAADQAGIPLPEWAEGDAVDLMGFVAFYEDGQPPEPAERLILLDSEGRARWRVPFKEATAGELVRASEAGVLKGDPRRPYLFLLGPQAGGGPQSWSALIEALHIVWKLLEAAAVVEGARALGKVAIDAARDRLGAGREVVQERYQAWDERGARPNSFSELLGLGPWHRDDLADRLDCSRAEAEAILWAYGYVPDSQGLWRLGTDDAAAFLAAATDDVQEVLRWNPDRGFERAYRRRIAARLDGETVPEARLPEEHEGH